MLALLLACKGPPAVDTETATATGDGVFAEGCPADDQALARLIGVDASLPGGDVAVGTKGDALLANEHAAFVITEPDKGSTYYYYGGVVADAAPMSGCTPGDDKLDEVGLVLGVLDLQSFSSSILRGFRGESIEIVNDGSDGQAAHIRVTGVDDTYWLVEYELIKDASDEGGRPLSEPLGLVVTVDYRLPPDSTVLEIELGVENVGDEDITLFNASLLSFGPTLDLYTYASDALSIGGLSLDYGIPWLLATDLEGALAYAVDGGSLAYTRISGIDVAVDVGSAVGDPLALAPGQSGSRTMYLSVGGSDGPSATRGLAVANPEPLPDARYTLETVSGVVVDPAGDPAPHAVVNLEALAPDADWGTLDLTCADDDGRFELPVPQFDTPWGYRLVASQDGRDASESLEVALDVEPALTVSAAGRLHYAVTADGEPSPARITLTRASDGLTEDLWVVDSGTAALAPGTWSYAATRGYEFQAQQGTVEVPADGSVTLEVALSRVVDTSGWLSADTHVHTSHSPDSRMQPQDQLLHAAAHGLEVMLNTDHEHIVDMRHEVAAAGLEPWVVNLTGEEVTAVVPEHMTMFPAEPDGSFRGGIVSWYQKDLEELFAAMRERSEGGINLFNHPGYLDLVGWDRVAAAPTMTDPTLIGLAADAAMWSWNFDGIEVLNGHGNPFVDGKERFDNWMSMVNVGYPIAPIGCSDDHGGDQVGFPRTYFVSPTDEPSSFEDADLVDAVRAGQVQASAGAFATVSVDGVLPGGTVVPTSDTFELDLTIQATPEADVTHAIVFANCDQVASVAATDPDGVLKLDTALELTLAEDAHLVVAAFGTAYLPAGLPQYDATVMPRVLTAPIFVDLDGDGWDAPGGKDCSYDLAAPDL